MSDLTTIAFDYIRAIYQSNPYDMNWQEIRKYLAGEEIKIPIFLVLKNMENIRDKHFEESKNLRWRNPAKEMLNSINYAKSLESEILNLLKMHYLS